ncbi:MAG: hypothetical protein KF785_10620 [Gemmatimonadales bacterium]|nr:hypothetical protein [Gemmatimonadales bacterium]
MLGCLSLPARLLGTALLVGAGYLAWQNQATIKRWVHRVTAETPRPIDGVAPEVRKARIVARFDSLAARRLDSVRLSETDVETLVADELTRQARGYADSVRIEFGNGSVALRAQVDADRLPPGALGPLSEWIKGRQTVEVRGGLSLLRLGSAEWRIEQVLVRGVPLPKALWEKYIGVLVAGAASSLVIPVDDWITGLRVAPGSLTLYGRGAQR